MIKLILKREVFLSNTNPPYFSKDDWEDTFKDNLPALKELFAEDLSVFWEDIGGLDIIEKAEWVDKQL